MNEDKPGISDAEWAKMGTPDKKPLPQAIPDSLLQNHGSGVGFKILMYIAPAIVVGGFTLFINAQKQQAKDDLRREKINAQVKDIFEKDVASGNPSDITLMLSGIDPEEYREALHNRGADLMTLAVVHNTDRDVDPGGIELSNGKLLTTGMLTFEGLELAVVKGETEDIHRLIDEGASVSQPASKTGVLTGDPKWTLLHLAAFAGEIHTVEALLKHGADKEAKLTTGRTPLVIARERKHAELVEFLLTGKRSEPLYDPSQKFWKNYGESPGPEN